ncbi:MAG: hypothetical protein PUG48_03325 [Clostridia bacterium]|nr:hypothetical protein [Clostridia bacterium]
MSENNSQKSPVTNTEVSPIRNLFRKNDTADVNAASVSKQTENKAENKAEPSNPEKVSDNKNKAKTSDAEKQKPTSESENKPEPKAEPKAEQKQEIKPETKQNPEPKQETKSDEEKPKTEEKTEEKTAEKNENETSKKENSDDKDKKDDVKSEKEPEPPKTLSEKEEIKSDENSDEEKSENDNKKSFFGKIKSKITDIIMSMNQPEEESEPQIEDIFSSSGNFVREKNADPLDADAEFKENVIYTAPKEEEKQPDKSVVSVSDVIKAASKNNEPKKSENYKKDTNDKDITEILNAERAEKNTAKPEKNKSETHEKITSQPENKPQKTENPQPVKSSEQKTNATKPQQNNINDKNTVQKTEPVKPHNNDTAAKKETVEKTVPQPVKSDKQVISENKPQNIKKPVEVHSAETPVENIKPATPKAVAEHSAENKKISENKNIEQPKPTQPQSKNVGKHSDNTAKIINEKPKNTDTQKPPKTDVPKTTEQVSQKNNTPKIDGDDGIKILPWTPKKDVPEKKPNVKAPDTKGKNLSEGSTDILVYHYNRTEPFVVMAGKFTKTVKSEYEEVRKFNSIPLDDSASEKPKNLSSPVVEKSVPKINQPVKSVLNNNTTSDRTTDIKLIDNGKKQSDEKHSAVSSKNTQKPVKSENIPSQNRSVKSVPQISEVKKPVDDDKKQPEQNKVKKSTAKKPQKQKKPKKNYNFRNIFSSEEEYDPEDIEKIYVQKPQLDDYTNEKDSETIKTEIAENFRHVFTRTGILFATTIISVVIAIIAQCIPSLFTQTIRNGWLVYAIINFLLFSVSVVVSRVPIVNGIMPLRHFKGNSDTAIAVASFAAAIQSIVALFSPNVFVNGTLYIYSSLVILALFLNSLGKMLIILRTYNNFRFLSKPRPKYAGKIYTDIRNAEKISSGLPSKKPIIAYTKQSKFMSNFLQLSYAPDPSEDAAAKIAPYATILSIVCGILYGVMTRDFVGAVSSFALSACITIPVCSLLAVNIPLKRLCHNSIKGGAMVTSYETVKQFCDTNVVMIDSSQLYPPGTVTLSGIKAFKESKINDAITAGAAIMFAVDGTMSYIFENIIQDRKDILPKVESVIYEDGLGLVGWINGQRVLIGNRRLLETHNITPPEKSIEEKYLNMGNQVMYISMSGELVAMFILSYTADREIMHELRNLEDNGVSFAVRTVDPNITQDSIAEKFCLFFRCIKILPTNLGNICHNATSSVDEKSRAYLVTRGKISSFARAVSGCIRIKSNITLSIIIQYIAIILGLLIVTLISFISGFEKLGCLEMLLYIGFWAAATIIIPLIKK